MPARILLKWPLAAAFLLSALSGSLVSGQTAEEVGSDLAQANYPVLMRHFSDGLAAVKQDGGNKNLSKYYDLLGKWENVPALQKWAQTEPKNHVPWTAVGHACLLKGQDYRGTDYINKVSWENRKLFEKYLDSSKAYLDIAVKMNPDDPSPYIDLMALGMHEGWSKDVMEGYLQKALQYTPGCETAIWHMAIYFSPLWGGSAAQMRQFVDQYGGTAPKGAYNRLLVVRYHEEVWHSHGGHNSYFGNTPAWREIKQECEDYLAAHPDDLSTRSWYSFLAFVGRHYQEAKQQFDVLGDRWNMNYAHWLTKEGYMHAKEVSNRLADDSSPSGLGPPMQKQTKANPGRVLFIPPPR